MAASFVTWSVCFLQDVLAPRDRMKKLGLDLTPAAEKAKGSQLSSSFTPGMGLAGEPDSPYRSGIDINFLRTVDL